MADGRFVDVLPAGAAGAEHVLAIIVGLDVDFDVFRLGQHGHRGGRGVDAALGFGLGHALHAMAAAFVLQLAVDAFAFDAQDQFLEAAQLGGVHVEDFDLPAAWSSAVVLVHVVQVAGEQGRLVAAGAGADFHHAARAVGVFAADRSCRAVRSKSVSRSSRRLGQLGLGQLAHLGVVAVDHLERLGDLLRSAA